MCSVGFDSQFGMNVKMYQQMQRTKFGMGVRSSGFNPQLSMNTGIFTAGKPNLFAANNTSSLNFNGVQYDNKYAMLNSVGNDDKNTQGADKSFKDILKDAGSVIKEAFSSIGEEIKSGFNSGVKFVKNLFGGKKSDAAKNGSEIGKQSLNDIQNAQDKSTLNQALQSANNDNQAVQQNLQNDNKALKTSQNQETKAQQGADAAEAGLNEANQGLDGANQELGNAQTEVQNAEQGLQTAKTNVATAQQALDAAKAAATPENPNSAAIAKAQGDLNTAKQEEQLAQKKLDEAKQRETQAQEGVSASEQEVQVSEQQNTEAQAGLEQAVSNTEAAEAQVQTTEARGEELTEGIEQGEQKMQQMDANTPAEGSTDTSGINSGVQSNVYENNGNYFVNGYQTNKDMYDAAQNMDQNVVQAGFSPGSTTDVYIEGQDEPQTFTVQNGKYLVNGQEVDSKTFVSEYNNAKANQEPGSGNDISLINDDYSKYKSGAGENRGTHISGQSTDSASAPGAKEYSRPAADESGNGQVDQEFKAKNQKREDAEWEAYKASRRAKK